jgi:hypothetical protein
MKAIIASSLLTLLLSSELKAGGAIGGGTGLIIRQDSPMISKELFQDLVVSGWNGEAVDFNGTPAVVVNVNFKQKTVELLVEGQAASAVLQEESAATGSDQ